MSNDPSKFAGAAEKRDSGARRKRFYTEAGVGACDGGFALLLDGRVARTPGKAAFVLPTAAAAEAIAREWAAQGETIDFTSMPLTRIAFAAIDAVAAKMQEVAAEIFNYAATDLVCYRADSPASLVRAEAEAWDPILAFAADRLGARFVAAEGVVFAPQPAAATEAVRKKVEEVARRGAVALACLSVMTTLTGSVLVALALAERAIGLDEAWRAAHVDEDYEMRLWGEDEAAMARRARRFAEMAAAEELWRRAT